MQTREAEKRTSRGALQLQSCLELLFGLRHVAHMEGKFAASRKYFRHAREFGGVGVNFSSAVEAIFGDKGEKQRGLDFSVFGNLAVCGFEERDCTREIALLIGGSGRH
jgi:hypothetical protein